MRLLGYWTSTWGRRNGLLTQYSTQSLLNETGLIFDYSSRPASRMPTHTNKRLAKSKIHALACSSHLHGGAGLLCPRNLGEDVVCGLHLPRRGPLARLLQGTDLNADELSSGSARAIVFTKHRISLQNHAVSKPPHLAAQGLVLHRHGVGDLALLGRGAGLGDGLAHLIGHSLQILECKGKKVSVKLVPSPKFAIASHQLPWSSIQHTLAPLPTTLNVPCRTRKGLPLRGPVS